MNEKTVSLSLIIEELKEWYGSINNIAEKTGISAPTISKALTGDVTATVQKKLEDFFYRHMEANTKVITVGELVVYLENQKAVMIDSPDGLVPIVTLHKKQPRTIISIESGSGKRGLSSNDHLYETDFGWVHAEKLKAGVNILTCDGFEPVTSIETLGIEPVFDFEVASLNHRYWSGDGFSSHNSGKSFLAGNAVVQAQKDGYHVLYLDSEHAVDVDYLRKIGAKIDEEHLTYISVTTIEDVNKVLSSFFVGYKKEYGKNNPDAPKTLIVLDSLAMLSSETEMDNYNKASGGVVKGDMGQLAKRRKAMLRLAVGQIGNLPITMLLTDHVYPQDVMLGDGAWAITNSTKFSTSVIGIVTKLKLKEDSEVVGVRMRVEAYKSRFAKLGSKVELEVPYNTGLSPLSGLVDLFESMGVIAKGTQPGEKTKWIAEWVDDDGEIHREAFTEKTLTEEQAIKIMKGHPLCQPMACRGGSEEEDDLAKLLADDSDETDD